MCVQCAVQEAAGKAAPAMLQAGRQQSAKLVVRRITHTITKSVGWGFMEERETVVLFVACWIFMHTTVTTHTLPTPSHSKSPRNNKAGNANNGRQE